MKTVFADEHERHLHDRHEEREHAMSVSANARITVLSGINADGSSVESSCLAAAVFGAFVIGILSWLLLSCGGDSQSDQNAAEKAAEDHQDSST